MRISDWSSDVCSSDLPRADIVAVEIDMPLDEVIALMGTSLHSRLPVYRKNLDDVVGMIHVKDVLVQARQETPAPLSALIKQVLFVSPSMRVLDLLLQMRLSRIHMGLVRSEEHTSELPSLMRISY